MIKRILFTISLLTALAVAVPSFAVDINLINVDMSPHDNTRLANAYGQAYGYTPQQVMPAMYGPPQEVPAIMQIAQAAGQVPMTIWMMRRMGMNYGSILSTFALAPTVLAGGPLGSPYGYPQGYNVPPPYWGRWTDPFYVQTARVNFLRNVLHVPLNMLPFVPVAGIPYARSLLYPYHPVHGTWLPPGIAKKYGLWIPPGQRKKIGWGPWGGGPSWKQGKHGWHDGDFKGDDWEHGGGKHGWQDADHGPHGKPAAENKGNGHGGSKQNLAQGNSHGKKNGGFSNGGSGKGGSKGGHGGGMGKGKNK